MPARSGRGRRPRSRPLVTTTLVAAVVAAAVTAVLTFATRRDNDASSEPVDRLGFEESATRDASPPTSVDRPAATGTRVAVGNGWTVMVHGSDPEATERLAPLNPELTPTDEQSIVLIDLEMTYLDGEREAESPFYGVDLAVVGEDGRVVTPADTPCVATDPVFDLYDEMALGSSRRGGICFMVESDQVDSLVLTATPSMDPHADTSWFALD